MPKREEWNATKMRQYISFLLAMTDKEIKARYKFSLFGFLWILLNPILQMVTVGLIFQFFVPVQVENYFLFLFVGLLPWNLFSMSVIKCVSAIITERQLIQKSDFPREIIIFSVILSNFVHFCAALGLLILLLIAHQFLTDRSFIDLMYYCIKILLLVPVSVLLVIVTTGFSLLFSALNVRFRDLNFIVQAVMPLWFYATPIIYTQNLIPTKLQPFFAINPMTGIIQLFQFLTLPNQTFSGINVLICVTLCIGIFILGWSVFKRQSPYFDDWI